jgi:UDP-N-acetylmuramoylalanine--D-glutamate ligase
MAALKSYLDKKIYLVIGGDDKGANLEPLFEFFQKLDIHLFAIGKNCQTVLALSKQFNIKVTPCDFLPIAVENMSQLHDQNSVAILSPAAASLDQFSSYKHRGDEFKRLVNSLS